MSFPSLKRYLNEIIADRKAAGCCAAVYVNGERRFRAFLGESGEGRAVNEHTAFRLASMTKPITAVAVLLLEQDGLLRVTDPVSAYLPAYGELYVAKKTDRGFVAGERAGEVTIRMLLTHSSGIGSGEIGDVQNAAMRPQGNDTLASAVDRYASGLLDFAPGTAQMYSPVLGFDVAARIVEIVSGMPYGKFVRERIFLPLGMRETSYNLTDYDRDNLAVTYRTENGELIPEPLLHNFDVFPAGYTGGGAGLISTLDDYCKFAESLRVSYEGGEGILSFRQAREMAKPQLDLTIGGVSPEFNWGYGVRAIAQRSAAQRLNGGSFGWSGAYGTHFWIDPVNRMTAVYMHNSSTYGGAGAPHTVDFENAVLDDVEG